VTLGEDLMGEGISYVTVENLRIQGWFRDGIALPTNFAHFEPHDLILRNNTIVDVDSTGIRLMTWVYGTPTGNIDGWRGGYTLLINGNTITRANRMGIDMASRSSTVTGNTIQQIGVVENLGASGLGCALDDGGGQCTEDGDGIRLKVDQPGDSGNMNSITGNSLWQIAFNGIDVFGHHNSLYHNVIGKACAVKGDCGGIRTFGRDSLASSPVRYVYVAENMIFDTIGVTAGCKDEFKPQFGFGLYIDNYSAYMDIRDNTVTGSTAAGILLQNSTAEEIVGNVLYDNAVGGYYTGQIVITGSPAHVIWLSGNIFYSLHDTAWTLSADSKSQMAKSDGNYFFNPYRTNHISVNGTYSLAGWHAASGHDAASVENWFTLQPGDPPNSHLFYNDMDQPVTIDLGGALYQDLDQQYVSGSLPLTAYQSRVLIHAPNAPDLAVSINPVGNIDVQPGGALAYTITVANNGDAPAAGIVLTHLLPAEIINASWQTTAGGVTVQAGSHFIWDLPDLSAGSEVTITVSGTFTNSVTTGQPIRLSAQVTTTTPEGVTGNNQASLLLGDWSIIYLPLIAH
jgi:uncharacterized repeat protein (TIGR01451 family)